MTSFSLLLVLIVIVMDSLGFSMYSIMQSANSDSFTTFFLIWMPFICFSCLIDKLGLSVMLNRTGMSGHPSLISYLRGKAF